MRVKRLLFRAFYYFRIGYSTYLALPVALIGWITLIYQLALKNIPQITWLFPRFSIFLITAIITLLPLGVILGWIHIKRSRGYKSEVDVSVEANPFNYKLTPGKERVLAYPLGLLSLKLLMKFYRKQGILSSEDEKEFAVFIEKYERLLKGESLK